MDGVDRTGEGTYSPDTSPDRLHGADGVSGRRMKRGRETERVERWYRTGPEDGPGREEGGERGVVCA